MADDAGGGVVGRVVPILFALRVVVLGTAAGTLIARRGDDAYDAVAGVVTAHVDVSAPALRHAVLTALIVAGSAIAALLLRTTWRAAHGHAGDRTAVGVLAGALLLTWAATTAAGVTDPFGRDAFPDVVSWFGPVGHALDVVVVLVLGAAWFAGFRDRRLAELASRPDV